MRDFYFLLAGDSSVRVGVWGTRRGMYRFKLHGHLLVFIKHPPISVGKVPKYAF